MLTHRLSAGDIALAETAILQCSPPTPGRCQPRVSAASDEGLTALTLSTGAGLEATFLPTLGMTCCSLRFDGQEFLSRRWGAEACRGCGAAMGLSLLHPWPDRLAAWSYTALGQTVRLPTSPLLHTDYYGLPINGVQSLGAAWHVDDHDADERSAWLQATLRFDREAQLSLFPFPHSVRLRAELAGSSLWLFTELRALSDSPVPVCFGYRAYLLPGGRREALLLPTRQRIETDEALLPTGGTERLPACRRELDKEDVSEVFADRAEQHITLESHERQVDIEAMSGLPVARVQTGRSAPYRILEFMAAPPDALSCGEFAVSEPGHPYHAVLRLDLGTSGASSL